ncbi:MaoC/PaaZ C-terminal domain-containing protein [Pseudonocardia acaciae]|uniref:MaoC/PaaZ C-terminal domain-containing protein n=1 Tax=Pseudonocardia acaciae TaxID=551276 RepID=UPI0014704858|nr:MaoC/PaaZ C-terminal domain-containing protein [Pseudonocardia acaciae]
MSNSLFFEDFYLGQRFESAEFAVSSDDLTDFARVSGDRHPMHTADGGADERFDGPIAHGPWGIARYFGLLFDSGVVEDSAIALLDTNWRYLAPVTVGMKLRFSTVVTGCRRRSDGAEGVVNRQIELRDDQGHLLQRGTSAFLVRARQGQPSDQDPAGNAPLTPRWARAVADRLAANTEFAGATQLFDGAIGLATERDEVQFRIYRGKIIEVAARTPRGASFTLRGDELFWTELFTGPRNDLMVRALRGQFRVQGDAYVYLQLTKPVHLLIDAARELVAEERSQ